MRETTFVRVVVDKTFATRPMMRKVDCVICDRGINYGVWPSFEYSLEEGWIMTKFWWRWGYCFWVKILNLMLRELHEKYAIFII